MINFGKKEVIIIISIYGSTLIKKKFFFEINSLTYDFINHKSTNLKFYSKSLRLGFRDGSPDRSPKINKETKKITVV